MKPANTPHLVQHFVHSVPLGRKVQCDVYFPTGYDPKAPEKAGLLLFNDGQDLPRMHFERIFQQLNAEKALRPVVVAGLHCSDQRQREYGTARQPDYKGRGDKAPQYAAFILDELLPFLQQTLGVRPDPAQTAFAGFSLGALSAIDMAWAHPEVFGMAGVFSGSLWWRSAAVRPEDPDADRIMHDIVRQSVQVDPRQRFWFQCGTLDEAEDRNNNGIIDAIDDTLDLIKVLQERGIPAANTRYCEIAEGRHEPSTWGKAMPDFLRWAFGRSE